MKHLAGCCAIEALCGVCGLLLGLTLGWSALRW